MEGVLTGGRVVALVSCSTKEFIDNNYRKLKILFQALSQLLTYIKSSHNIYPMLFDLLRSRFLSCHYLFY